MQDITRMDADDIRKALMEWGEHVRGRDVASVDILVEAGGDRRVSVEIQWAQPGDCSQR